MKTSVETEDHIVPVYKPGVIAYNDNIKFILIIFIIINLNYNLLQY